MIDLAALLRELYPSPSAYHCVCLTARLCVAALYWHPVAPPTAHQVVHGAPLAAPLIVEETNVAPLLWARPPCPDLPNWGEL